MMCSISSARERARENNVRARRRAAKSPDGRMERRTVQKNPMSLQVGRTWPEGAIAFDPRPKRQLPNLGDRKSNLREMSRHLNPSIGKWPHLLRVGNPLFAWPWKRYSLH